MIRANNIIISYSDLLRATTQEKIMSYYLKLPIDLNRLYISPLRKDKNPTCSFYYTPAGMLRFHDFGLGQHYGALDVVMEMYKVSYGEAIKIIKKDLPLINEGTPVISYKEDITLYFSTTNIAPYYYYWEKFKISLATLQKYKVEAGAKVFRNDKLYLYSTKDNPIFIYNFPSGRIKIYRPLSKDKKKKWYGNSNGQDIGGFLQLNQTGSVCLITSSLKDVMVLHELGIPAVCLNGEGYGNTGESKDVMKRLISNLSKRFRYLFFFMNNDEDGMRFNAQLSRTHHLSYLFIPQGYPKDISDFISKFGRKKTWKLLKKIISKKVKIKFNLPY